MAPDGEIVSRRQAENAACRGLGYSSWSEYQERIAESPEYRWRLRRLLSGPGSPLALEFLAARRSSVQVQG